jgi:biopolymer transport protein TolR
MAIHIGSSNGNRPGSRLSSMAEINVTPLVDVMMVLLIVFMVSAPMMQQGVQVELPKANAGSLNEVPEQLVLVVNRAHQVQINGNVIAQGSLREKLAAIQSARPDVQIFIQADQGVAYGYVAQVMAEVKQAKITRIGLVTSPAELGQKSL